MARAAREAAVMTEEHTHKALRESPDRDVLSTMTG